jgi:hypothetical protein
VLTAHANGELLESPSLTVVKVPPGGRYEIERALKPQQTSVAFVLIPQVCAPPALTALKVPLGGTVEPSSSWPQHATVLSILIAHVWRLPALTALKVPPGGVA